MKTREIMQYSGKNFKRKSDGLMIEITEDGALKYKSSCPEIINIHDEWEEVKEPVSFLEAVESRKEIKVEHYPTVESNLDCYMYLDDFLYELGCNYTSDQVRDIILNGEFYIK